MPQTSIRVFCTAAGETPLLAWLQYLEEREPQAHVKCLERILQLEAFGYELRRPACDALRDGIRELRAKAGRVHYRLLYFFCGANVACISHGITKKGSVPDGEIEIALARKKLVDEEPDKYTADWEV